MRFLRKLIVNGFVVMVCAMLIEASGMPVSTLIHWGGTQVATVAQEVPWPQWAVVGRAKEWTEPVQAWVERTSGWVGQLRSDVKW